jgi:hypothetical protein
LDTHELRKLLDTADSKQQRHERRVDATVDSRMQAGDDNADEGQPPDEAAIHYGIGASDGEGAHIGVRSNAQEHTRHGAALRRILQRYGVQLKTADVFWGWVA